MDVPKEFLPVLLVQIALFLGLWMVLKRLWFDPALRLIKAREQRSHGAVKEAKKVEEEAQKLRVEHTAAIEQAKAEAQAEVQEMLRRAEAEQRTTIARAHEDAGRTMAEMRASVAQELAAARRDAQADVHVLAREVAKAVMGRMV